MKNKILLAFAIMVVFLLPFGATAQEDLVDPGVTPDSPLYGLDKAMDSLSMAMTSGSDAKVAKGLDIAEERLAEIKAMGEKGDIEAMQEAEDEHEQLLTDIETELENIEDTDSEEELKRELEIEQKIEDHADKVEQVKDGLRVKIKIKGDITPEQQALIDSILTNLEGQTGKVKIKIDNEKGKTKIKIELETGKEGDDVEDELEDELGITEKKQEKAAKKIAHVQEELSELSAEAEAANVTLSEDSVAQINDLLDQAQTAFDANDFKQAKKLAKQADKLLDDLEDSVEDLLEEEDESEKDEKESDDKEEDETEDEDKTKDKDDTEDKDDDSKITGDAVTDIDDKDKEDDDKDDSEDKADDKDKEESDSKDDSSNVELH